ncbi:phosphoribosylformylglycinamidine synthase [Blattabacterium cuenoti]|uniref:phosphoribosylformylglycinamidine synthase n=1 Tax=Blattabacterium cuenoti TaxID=1653831 RepID=UPI00163B7754|nr:phosphoribosylformylglycinamidine synthase [Blattabacterium cuenoti]
MNFRIYIQKKNIFNISSRRILREIKEMNISLNEIIIYHVYDIINIEENVNVFFNSLLQIIFVDPVTDILFYNDINIKNPHFYIEDFPGNNDRAEAAMQCIKILCPKSNAIVKTSQLIELIGIDHNNKKDLNKIKKYYQHIDDEYEKIIKTKYDSHIVIDKFINLSYDELIKFHKLWNLSIGIDNLIFIQEKFIKYNRNPTKEEIRILDTYWSDHCRHTTFFTTLSNITFNGKLKKIYENIYTKYLNDREKIGFSKKPINFMELSNLPYKILHQEGKLKNFVLSNEHNSFMMKINVDVINNNNKIEKEKWYLLFKNESHNHPTEIDPFHGASTCIGGAIRDPLSGRSFVYQGIRLSGAANPMIKKTIDKKLPQHKICLESAMGYSSYGNQIGLATSHVHEIYHEGYKAKRMEIGMVIGAVPIDFVRQEEPKKGDIVLLIGGLTGKDGIGGATDSSKEYDDKNSKKIGVKGNPIIERKIQRFFRKKEVVTLIKKSNDFGAGGAAVSIGELSDSIELYLDKIPIKKIKGNMEAIDIALSESQERIAVVLDSKNVSKFIRLADEENIKPVYIAKITDNKKIVFYYKGNKILNLESHFLNTGGIRKKQKVQVDSPVSISPINESKKCFFSETTFLKTISELNIASQKNLVEMFDSTVGGTTVLMPFGGKYQMTPSEGSVHKIPVHNGKKTNTVSFASWGFHPEISAWSPFHGGMYSIIECISKIVSMGGNYRNTYFSFQEYYQKLGNNPKNWGKTFSALLGAYHAQMSLELASIGGKDSMSGTYKDIHVPPTLIAFGVAYGACYHVISPEFKKVGNKIYLYHHKLLKDEIPDFNSIKNAYDKIFEGISSGKIISVKTVKDGGISIAIAKMSFGNRLGAVINCKNHLLETHIGSLILETTSPIFSNDFILIGEVVSDKKLIFNEVSIDIKKSIESWSKTFHSIFSYSTKEEQKQKNIKKYNFFERKTCKQPILWKCKYTKKVNPHVFIPIFPGTNGEFESITAFKKEGAIVDSFVFNNINNKSITESIICMKKYIESVQILMFCGGFSAGDEPDGAGKFIVTILHNKFIKDAIMHFLEKDGLILGICNGFQGLIKSGLLPYGRIGFRNDESPTLTYNKTEKHISQCVHIKVVSDHSPWLHGMKNKMYTLPISHGEGRFYASEKITNDLFEKNQVAAQYVDLQGNPSLETAYNPNGSIGSIEGLLSKNGKIYGRMTHPERCNDYGLLKNISNDHDHGSIFKNAVQYFL